MIQMRVLCMHSACSPPRLLRKACKKFKTIGKPHLGEKYVEGRRRRRKEGLKKNNAKISGHYVLPRTHNVHIENVGGGVLRSFQKVTRLRTSADQGAYILTL